MYTEALKTIFNLAKNDQIIKEIRITKKGIRVRWTQDNFFSWIKNFENEEITTIEVTNFLELYDMFEERLKK